MVDQEIFSRRLAALARYCEKLNAFKEIAEDEFVAEDAYHDLAERYLHLAVEAALDLCNHVIASESLRTPETNADTFQVLADAGRIDPDLARRLRGWAGFRNILVHDYLAIDHRISYQTIRGELGDLDEVIRWGRAQLD